MSDKEAPLVFRLLAVHLTDRGVVTPPPGIGTPAASRPESWVTALDAKTGMMLTVLAPHCEHTKRRHRAIAGNSTSSARSSAPRT